MIINLVKDASYYKKKKKLYNVYAIETVNTKKDIFSSLSFCRYIYWKPECVNYEEIFSFWWLFFEFVKKTNFKEYDNNHKDSALVINIKKLRIKFESRKFLSEKKEKTFTQKYISILNGKKMSSTIIAIDLNIFWKPKWINTILKDGANYKEFAWLFFQIGCKYNIPLKEKEK